MTFLADKSLSSIDIGEDGRGTIPNDSAQRDTPGLVVFGYPNDA